MDIGKIKRVVEVRPDPLPLPRPEEGPLIPEHVPAEKDKELVPA